MSSIPQLIEIGKLASIKQKAMLPYDGMRPVLFVHDASTAPLAVELAEGFVLQLLHNLEFGPVQSLLYEARPSSGYGHLKRLFQESEGSFGQEVVQARDCIAQLEFLKEKAHQRYTLFATANCADINEYNAVAPVPEPLYAVILQGIDRLQAESHVLETVRDLCESGPQVGLVPILLFDTSKERLDADNDFKHKHRDAFWSAVLPLSIGLDLRQSEVYPINLDAELWNLLKQFQLFLGLPDALRRQWVETILNRRELKLQASSEQDFLHVEIGRDSIRPAFFRLGEGCGAYHGLLGGTTRTGKSTLLNNLILRSCEQYSPNALRLWLFDYKNGLEFINFSGLAHVEVLHTDNMDHDGAIAAFAAFCDLVLHRTKLFKQYTPTVRRLADYNRIAQQPLPRCLMIIDEAHRLFEDRTLKPHAKRMLQEIARGGAAYGLHVLFSTQSYRNVDLEADVKSQFRLRMGLHLSDSFECRALMGRDNDAPLTLPPFTVVYNNNFGEANDNRIIALHGLSDLHERLVALRQRYPGTQKIFTSNNQLQEQTISKSHNQSEIGDWGSLSG
jgi:hypothetical protein